MAHQIQIKELINGIQITETVDNEIVIKFLSYQGKPFFRTTNETDEETYQIIDKVGEIYNLPALATEFVLIDINDVVYIPANGAELIEYSVKLKPFRSETEEDQSHIGTITTTANSLTINLADDGVNWAKINGSFYERFYPDTFNFVPVTTGQKILIVYAIPDAMPFRLVQGVEGTEAVEPDYDGLFIARILVSSAGQVIEEAEPLRPKIQEESAWRNVIANNTAQWLQMTGTAGTSFNVQVAAGSSAPKIAGLRTKVNQNVYDGMELHFYNDSDTAVTFVAGDYAQTPNSTSIPFKENYIVQPRTTVEFKRKNNVFELMQSGASFPTGNTGDVLVKTATGEEFSPRLTVVETALGGKLDKPTEDGSWVVTKSGNTYGYAPAGASYNIMTSDLTTSGARVQTQSDSFTWNTAGHKYYLKNLVDKTGDASFSKMVVQHPTTGEMVTKTLGDRNVTIVHTHIISSNTVLLPESINWATGNFVVTNHGLSFTGQKECGIFKRGLDLTNPDSSTFLTGAIPDEYGVLANRTFVKVVDSNTLSICKSDGSVLAVNPAGAYNSIINPLGFQVEIYQNMDFTFPEIGNDNVRVSITGCSSGAYPLVLQTTLNNNYSGFISIQPGARNLNTFTNLYFDLMRNSSGYYIYQGTASTRSRQFSNNNYVTTSGIAPTNASFSKANNISVNRITSLNNQLAQSIMPWCNGTKIDIIKP